MNVFAQRIVKDLRIPKTDRSHLLKRLYTNINLYCLQPNTTRGIFFLGLIHLG